jgi:hypothetical protein
VAVLVGWGRHLEQLAAARKLVLSAAVTEESVVPDTLESFRQNVDQEPTDELVGSAGHNLLPIVAIILPPELNFVFVDSEQPVVGDGNAMGITGDVL